jgi:hypothetical protein
MSNISNPLAASDSYTIKHVLVAYKYSDDAYNATGFSVLDARHGARMAHDGIVLINELADTGITVGRCETVWSYYSQFSSKSTEYLGVMEVVDTSGHVFSESLKQTSKVLDTSIHHLTFAWYTFFYDNDDVVMFQPNPLYFHITKYAQTLSGNVGRTHILEFVAAYNTHGLMPQFSKLFQTTITHRDSCLSDSLPLPVGPSAGIRPTRIEESDKRSLRTSRMNKVKYMSTIVDVLNGLEAVLDNQKVTHKKPLQKFMSIIRDEYTDKLSTVSDMDIVLPIDYTITLDSAYANRSVNNRNLPFEQYEISQHTSGISTMTIPAGATILYAINNILKLSRQIANEHTGDTPTSYKITTTTSRVRGGEHGQYKVKIKIVPHLVPRNEVSGKDSGPGNSMIDDTVGVLEYIYDNVDPINNNIKYISVASTPTISLVSKEINELGSDAGDIYGNREVTTSRRGDTVDNFFKSGYAGVSTTVSERSNNGLEDSTSATTLATFNEAQQTTYIIAITGNPYLINDINRNPNEVTRDPKTDNKQRGIYKIYNNVESEPMYVKLNLFLSSPKTEETYFNSGYVHLYKIRTVFHSGMCSQELHCARTDAF